MVNTRKCVFDGRELLYVQDIREGVFFYVTRWDYLMGVVVDVKLSPKQQAFADYYIELANATEAAIKAGYSPKYAGQNADKLLKNTKIRTYLDERMAEIQSKRIAKQEEILETITRVLRGEESGTALVGVGMGEQAVEQVAPTVSEKMKAAELLGKRYAMWTDKQQVEGNIPIMIVNDLDD